MSAPRRRSVGRPSKGDRHTFTTRIPTKEAEKLFAVADSQGVSASTFIADLVIDKLATIDLASISNQQELPINRVS